MGRKLIDLSMPVHNDMIVFPRVVRPALVMYETWQQFAERVGAAKYGAPVPAPGAVTTIRLRFTG